MSGLPLLPGTSSLFSDPSKKNFRKSHALDFRNGVPVFDDDKPGIGGELKENQLLNQKLPNFKIPPELAIQAKVLKFDTFFEETVIDSRLETKRIRKCVLHFYLQDGSIAVLEPKSKNSGIPQGVLIKRHRIPSSNPEKEFYGLEDVQLGYNISLYGKVFHIVDAEDETKLLLKQMGFSTDPAGRVPEDPFTIERQKQDESLKQKPPSKKSDPLKQFLLNDGKVLRFYCYWDDRNSVYGDLRKFKLHYFLADDTIEVVEQLRPNSGRDAFPTFIKRQKPPEGLQLTALRVGQKLNIFCRDFVLYDCDAFTKEYLKAKGITDFPTIFVDDEEPTETIPAGEDYKSLVPKVPKKNFQKMLDNDRKILRFSASLISTKPEDQKRVFVVSYYLADDTIGIYEPPQRNSGILGGKFLERRQVDKPDTGVPYQAEDLYVGAVIEVFCHRFLLQDADEYAFNHMEGHAHQFPKSNLDLVEAKIRSRLTQETKSTLKAEFRKIDTDGNNYVSLEEFRTALLNFGFQLTEHEIITLIRSYDRDGDGHISYKEFEAALQ